MADHEPDEPVEATASAFDFVELEPTVTTVEADLFLEFEDDDTAWDPDAVFAAAVRGIVDALLPPVLLTDSHVHSDGDFTFARDLEATAPPIDRRGSYLLQKKVKERASNALNRALKHPLYGNSRNPSRSSSRAQSRVSAALTSSVMAMKVARLAFGISPAGSTNIDAPFRINEWNEDSSEKSMTRSKATAAHGEAIDPYSELSSRYSLGSPATNRTSRVPVDCKEVRRREEIARDIETREGREKMTARIQRKGNLKLKLRSMADPFVSVEREEREAAKKSRGGLLSRGMSRVGIPTAADGTAGPGALTRVNSVISGVDLNSLATTTSRSFETTYRPEDYEGLASELVMLDKKGELLIGENCHLVARKPRNELQRDLTQQNTVKPRVHFPPEESVEPDAGSLPPPPQDTLSVSKTSPGKGVSRQSPTRQPEASLLVQNALFEGKIGQFQSYPKIELDPKKTPLTKGVTIKPPELPAPGIPVAAPAALKDVVNPHVTKLKPGNPVMKMRVSEDHTNDLLELQMTQMMKSSDKAKPTEGRATRQTGNTMAASTNRANPAEVGDSNTVQSSARSTARSTMNNRTSGPPSPVLPHNNHHRDQELLQGLRLRTPAYGNRSGRPGATVLGISRGEFLDRIDDEHADLHEAVNHSGTLQTPSKLSRSNANLPQFSSYVREFPTPPKGQIHIISSKAAAALVSSPTKANKGFPFSSLPSVIQGKR